MYYTISNNVLSRLRYTMMPDAMGLEGETDVRQEGSRGDPQPVHEGPKSASCAVSESPDLSDTDAVRHCPTASFRFGHPHQVTTGPAETDWIRSERGR